MYEWTSGNGGASSANPNEGRFTLSVEKSKSSQMWIAMVDGDALKNDDNGAELKFANPVEAKTAAEAAYNDYWADFDD